MVRGEERHRDGNHVGDSTQAVDSRTRVPQVIITALSEQPRPWCRVAAKIFRLKEGGKERNKAQR
eukprot:scaffold49710_cov36-Phaeocystis_antarctica.AAC.1